MSRIPGLSEVACRWMSPPSCVGTYRRQLRLRIPGDLVRDGSDPLLLSELGLIPD